MQEQEQEQVYDDDDDDDDDNDDDTRKDSQGFWRMDGPLLLRTFSLFYWPHMSHISSQALCSISAKGVHNHTHIHSRAIHMLIVRLTTDSIHVPSVQNIFSFRPLFRIL
jgi:hypothetical protein